MNGRRATLEVEGLPVIDTFQFFGPNDTPALVDFRVDWFAIRPAVERGEGDTVPPDDHRAWLGDIARAESVGTFSGEEIGFAFEAEGSTARGWGQLGTERNGVFL
jgi:hypothetical protein